MSDPSECPPARSWRTTWFSRRAVTLHVTVAIVVPAFLALAWWQYLRATGGNDLSWAYTFEWPFFAAYGVFMWWKLLHEWPATSDADDEEEEVTEIPGGDRAPVAPALSARFVDDLDVGYLGGLDDVDGADDDEELRSYNEYLAALNASDRRKTW